MGALECSLHSIQYRKILHACVLLKYSRENIQCSYNIMYTVDPRLSEPRLSELSLRTPFFWNYNDIHLNCAVH